MFVFHRRTITLRNQMTGELAKDTKNHNKNGKIQLDHLHKRGTFVPDESVISESEIKVSFSLFELYCFPRNDECFDFFILKKKVRRHKSDRDAGGD